MLAILGDPVAHSLSPAMQNAAITALGLESVYVAFRVPATAFDHALDVLTALGVAGNITVPHKVPAATRVATLTATARAVGAVNTFWCDDAGVHGDNTDVAGVLESVDHLEAVGPWIVCGTGGTARAVVVAAAQRGIRLLLRSRSEDRAAAFAEWARAAGADARVDDAADARTVINATPLGLRADDRAPLDLDRLDGVDAVLDLVYARGETAWVRNARRSGLRALDGRAMLVAQGAAAFERFFPEHRAPRDVMRATVQRLLAQ